MLALSVLAAPGLAGCTSGSPPEWPDLGGPGDPHYIAVDQLEVIPGETHLDPHAVDRDGPPPLDREAQLVEQHYPHLTLGGLYPSAGTSVFFAVDQDRFYLLEDHMMGHFDTPIGPFRGDPRVVLPSVVRPTGG